MKRLGIYYATACYKDAQGRYFTSPGLGRYLEVMNRLFPFEVVLLAPVTRARLPHLGYPLPAERVSVYELPYFETFLGAVRVRRGLVKRLRRFLDHHTVDVVWLRNPGAYATELWLQCRRRGIPCFYEIVVDAVLHFEYVRRYPFPLQWVAKSVVLWHEREMKRIATVTPTFAVAKSLAKKMGISHVTWLPSSTVSKDEFYYRNDTCCQSPYRLLYVGALTAYKDPSTLIEAVKVLQDTGVPVEMDIVGDGDLRSMVEQQAVNQLKPGTFRFHGYCNDKAALHRYYCEADVFAMSSVTEGFPRVILEAMARGLPVVATNIVGIPDLVHDGETGLLVPVRSPQSLAAAVRRIIEDGDLRRRIIAGGYRVAEEHTVEKFLQRVVELVRTRVGVDLTE